MRVIEPLCRGDPVGHVQEAGLRGVRNPALAVVADQRMAGRSLTVFLWGCRLWQE